MDQQKSWIKLLEFFSKISSKKDVQCFFDLFFTFEEKDHLASRYIIIQELLSGELTQREIAKKYNVSIAQITRGSNALKIVDPAFKKFLKQKLQKG